MLHLYKVKVYWKLYHVRISLAHVRGLGPVTVYSEDKGEQIYACKLFYGVTRVSIYKRGWKQLFCMYLFDHYEIQTQTDTDEHTMLSAYCQLK